MKRNLITALSLIACCTAFSQENIEGEVRSEDKKELSPKPTTVQHAATPTKEIKKSKGTVTISKRAGQPQQVHDAAYYQKEIVIIDDNLTAIDQKIVSVNNDPQEKQLAESQGWFDNMELIKQQLIAKKASLQQKLANL
jgi:NAD/NADP transhydrogenase alpha subunit